MSKRKLFTTKGYLLTNASRLRGAPTRTKTPIEPKDDLHANDCGCLRCRVTHRVDDALDGQLGKQSTPAPVGNALPPSQGVFNKRPKGNKSRTGPLMLPRGVLAGDAS
jgi:hypothetical protein